MIYFKPNIKKQDGIRMTEYKNKTYNRQIHKNLLLDMKLQGIILMSILFVLL